jgi:hypothetical protein
VKLGKRDPVFKDTDFKATKMLPEVPLHNPPVLFGHGRIFTDWEMYANDKYGDCVFAGGAHEDRLANRLARRTINFTDDGVLSDYSAVTGFDKNDPNSDQGTVVSEALSYRRHKGLIDAHGDRHKIGAYVSITPGDYDEMMYCTYWFSAVGMGFNFPNSAFDQFDANMPWDVVPSAQIIGGHYVPVVGRSHSSRGTCVTWGRRQEFTRKFYEKYNDEAWAMVYPEELRGSKTERGLSLDQLVAAVEALSK